MKQPILLLSLAMISWGISWAAGKIISNMASIEMVIFCRFLVTFISLIPVMHLFKVKYKINRLGFLMSLIGALIMFLYNQLFFAGLKEGLPGIGGVLVTTLNPIINFVLLAILYKKRLHLKESIGLILGLLGGLVIMNIWTMDPQKIFSGGNAYFLVASFVWAILSIVTQISGHSIHPIAYTLYLYGFSTLLSIPFVPFNNWQILPELSYVFWGIIFYLSVISTTFGTTVYFVASSRMGSKFSSSFIFLVPVTALLGSWLFVSEIPKISTIMGGFLAISAVYLINKKGKETPK